MAGFSVEDARNALHKDVRGKRKMLKAIARLQTAPAYVKLGDWGQLSTPPILLELRKTGSI